MTRPFAIYLRVLIYLSIQSYLEVREVHGQGMQWRGCAFSGRPVPMVYMVVNWILGQMALVDCPMAAGIYTLFLMLQL